MDRIHNFFFSLLLVFLPTQLGYHVWPAWAMVLGRRIDYLAPTLYFTDILIFLVLFFWLMELFSRIMNHESGIMNEIGINKTLYSSSILFFIFVGFNIFFAANPLIAIYKWIKVLEFVALGYYIVKTKVQLSAIGYQLSAGILYSSLIAIAQFFFQHSIGGPFWLLGERTFTVDTPGIARVNSCQLSAVSCQLLLRAYGTFPHPNVLGGYLAVILPLIIIQLSNNPIIKLSNRKKIFYFVTSLLGIVALVLTFSRSAIIVGAAAIGLVFWQNTKRKTLIRAATGMIIGLVLLFIIYHLSFGISQSESVVVREQLNMSAMKIWQSSPFIGVGLGNFLVELPKALPSRSVYFLQPVHNIYLLVLAETGIAGLSFFLWIILKSFQKPFVICHLSFIILLLLGLVDHYPLTIQQGQLLVTLLFSLHLVYTSGHERH